MFAVLNAAGEPQSKAEALLTILTKRGLVELNWVDQIGDKEVLTAVFGKLCGLACWELFLMAKKAGAVGENLYS